MDRNRYSRVVGRLLALFAVALTVAVPTSASWNEKVLYSFQGGTDGQLPVGSIVFDSAGNLYGATTQGGATNCSPLADCGTVFQLTPPPKQGDPWTETVLYTFKGAKYSDGDEPAGGLLIDSKGNLYGTTAYGGTGDCVLLGVEGGCGTVYELSPPSEKGGTWLSAEWRSGVRYRGEPIRSNRVRRRERHELRRVLSILRSGVRAESAENQGRQVDGKGAARFQGSRLGRAVW
jgi:hypothetical protein